MIELLVVIAIIAILSVVVILTLNPAELLRQARDSNRISDMATLKSSISLYLADVTSPSLGTSTVCYAGIGLAATNSPYLPGAGGVAGTWAQPSGASGTCQAYFQTNTVSGAAGLATSTLRGVGGVGSGWIPVNFSAISAGSPIGALPIDPVNTAGTGASRSAGAFFYSYIPGPAASTTFKLAALMESNKYSNNGPGDVVSTDGGINNYVYEQGTGLTL